MRMNKELRDRYLKNIYAAVHTISGKCDNINDNVVIEPNIVGPCLRRKKRGKEGEYNFYLKLNANKAVSSTTMIKKYSEYKKIIQDVLELMEAENFQITRADLSFNSNDTEDYKLFKKLNKLLLCCLADANNIKNCYQSYDLWTNESLSIAIKNDIFEAENYNKELESHGTVETKSRLEFRSKRIKGTLENEFLGKWFKRLDTAVEHFEMVQNRFNAALLQIWKADIEKSDKDKDFISLTSFLLRYKDCIFSRKQLENLLEMMGVEKPQIKASKFKERHKIEFYSKTDLNVIVKALKKATENYFKN